MKADLVSFLRCPARDCNAPDLKLRIDSVQIIEYKDGPMEEVSEGALECLSCGRSYPIHEYVPSFEQLFPEGLKREAEYWGKWYTFMWDRGYFGFFDLREPIAPLITEGIEIPDPSTLGGIDLGGTHSIIADHPRLADAEWLLDVGCGTGWSSLYFARRGHKVVAFDPAVTNMRLAKRYAISKGEYVEYMGAGLGFLSFKPETFDGAVALHSIHHVPDLVNEMGILRGWLKPGAGIGIDEHVRNNKYLMEIMAGAREWSQKELLPPLRTLSPDVLAGIPREEPSEMEGAGSGQIIESFLNNFELDSFSSRYITFDMLSFYLYLYHDRNTIAYAYGSSLVDRIYKFLHDKHPENAEHVMLIGYKGDGVVKHANQELRDQALRLALGINDPDVVEALSIRDELTRLQQEVRDAEGQLQHFYTSTGKYITHLEDVISKKDKQIKELEAWARSLERDLRKSQASPTARVRKRVSRLMKRK